MPFCTNCGTSVTNADVYCAACGSRQQAQGSMGPKTGSQFLSDISPRTASMLCYVPLVGWLAGIVVLAAPHFQNNKTVRFHAFQGLYLFVVYLIADWVLVPWFGTGRWGMGWGPDGDFNGPALWTLIAMKSIFHMLVFAAWVWMIIKTSQERMFRLPILGELADRSVAEQR